MKCVIHCFQTHPAPKETIMSHVITGLYSDLAPKNGQGINSTNEVL